ncbi:MAG TPA: hypothetical protein PLV92_07510 [Pirellulaceae bacterium]|nr:hypothetical protein [Pirellulaceae bacterium]
MNNRPPLKLAMWSGPRNISTAMMRAWGNRADTVVVDEPLYAHYLSVTRKDHPGRDEIIETGETDWRRVVAGLTGDVPEGRSIYYQKQMTHHLLPDIGRDWLGLVTHAFLIRHPREMLTSYIKIVDSPSLEDTGFPQQTEIFEWVRANRGVTPPVVDTVDVLNDPRRMLGLLCEALGVAFDEAMLSWPPGPRATDGVWAKHWYGEVEKSTSFRPYKPKDEPVPPELADLYDQCVAHYERLYPYRLR